MKVNLFKLVICSLYIITAHSAHAETLTGQTICICEDSAEWPPYHYLKREYGKKTKEAAGYGIDVFNEIFGFNLIWR